MSVSRSDSSRVRASGSRSSNSAIDTDSQSLDESISSVVNSHRSYQRSIPGEVYDAPGPVRLGRVRVPEAPTRLEAYLASG